MPEPYDFGIGTDTDYVARTKGQPISYGSSVQFRHMRSGKYLSIVPAERSVYDPSAMKVKLTEEPSEHTIFIVNPAFRISSTTDKVTSLDSIILRSHKLPNIFLRSSSNVLTNTSGWGVSQPYARQLATGEYVEQVKELNGLRIPDFFHIILFRQPEKGPAIQNVPTKNDTAQILGSRCVRLRHRNTNGYLYCNEEGVVEFQQPGTKLGISSIWRIVSLEDGIPGGPIRSKDGRYGLVSFAADKFLSAKPRDAVELTETYLSAKSAWSMHESSAYNENIGVGDSSYKASVIHGRDFIHLRNDCGGYWMGNVKRRTYRRRSLADINVKPGQTQICVLQTTAGLIHPQRVYAKDMLDFEVFIVDDTTIDHLSEAKAISTMLSNVKAYLSCLQPLPELSDPNPQQVKQALLQGWTDDKPSDSRHPFCREKELFIHLEHILLQALNGLCSGGRISWSAPVDVEYQDAMFEVQIIEVAMDVLKDITRLLGNDDSSLLDLSAAAVGVDKTLALLAHFFSQCCKDHEPNKASLAHHQHYLLRYIGSSFGFVDTLNTLYTNNRSVLLNITEKEIAGICNRMKDGIMTERSPAFVRLLSVICLCDGHSVPKTQNVITMFLMEHTELLLEVDIGQNHVFVKESHQAVSLSEFKADDNVLEKAMQLCSEREVLYRRYLATMNLYHCLCFGRNRLPCDFLLQNSELLSLGISYLNLMQLSAIPGMPYPVRSAALKLMSTLYVDREPRQRLHPLRLLWTWPGIKIKKSGMLRTHQDQDPFAQFEHMRPTSGFVDLKASILSNVVEVCTDVALPPGLQGDLFSSVDLATSQYLDLDVNYRLSFRGTIDQVQANEHLQQCIMSLKLMLHLGCFHQNKSETRSYGSPELGSLKVLCGILVDLLDGRNDQSLNNQDSPTRFHFCRITRPIMECKVLIAELLMILFDIRLNVRVKNVFERFCDIFIRHFGDKMEDMTDKQLYELPKDGPDSCWNIDQLVVLAEEQFKDPILHPAVAMGSLEGSVSSPPEFVQILLDACRYEHQPFVIKSLELLFRHFTQRAVLIHALTQVQITVLPSIAEAQEHILYATSELLKLKKMICSHDVLKKNAATSESVTHLTSLLNMGAPRHYFQHETKQVQREEVRRLKCLGGLERSHIHICILGMLGSIHLESSADRRINKGYEWLSSQRPEIIQILEMLFTIEAPRGILASAEEMNTFTHSLMKALRDNLENSEWLEEITVEHVDLLNASIHQAPWYFGRVGTKLERGFNFQQYAGWFSCAVLRFEPSSSCAVDGIVRVAQCAYELLTICANNPMARTAIAPHVDMFLYQLDNDQVGKFAVRAIEAILYRNGELLEGSEAHSRIDVTLKATEQEAKDGSWLTASFRLRVVRSYLLNGQGRSHEGNKEYVARCLRKEHVLPCHGTKRFSHDARQQLVHEADGAEYPPEIVFHIESMRLIADLCDGFMDNNNRFWILAVTLSEVLTSLQELCDGDWHAREAQCVQDMVLPHLQILMACLDSEGGSVMADAELFEHSSVVLDWLATATESYLSLLQVVKNDQQHRDTDLIVMDHHERSLRALVYAGIFPFIKASFRWGLVSVDQRQVHRISLVADVLACMTSFHTKEEIELLDAVSFGEKQAHTEEMEPFNETLHREGLWYNLVQSQWKGFINSLASNIGIATQGSGQMMGEGMRLLALMLTQKDIPVVTSTGVPLLGHFGVYAACNHPPHRHGKRWALNSSAPPSVDPNDYCHLEYHYVPHRITSLLRDSTVELDSKVRSSLVALCRAMVHVDDHNNSEELQMQYHIGNPGGVVTAEEAYRRWQLCTEYLPIEKSAPAREHIHWVQDKYVLLGFASAALHNAVHSSSSIKLEALHLGLTLLQHGNRHAQTAFMDELKNPERSHNFFQGCKDICDDMARMVERQMTFGAKTSLPNSKVSNAIINSVDEGMEDSFREAFELTMASLKTLLLLTKGTHSVAQEWMLQQGNPTRSINMFTELLCLFECLLPELPNVLRLKEWRVMSLITILSQTFTEFIRGASMSIKEALLDGGVVGLVVRCFKSLTVVIDGTEQLDDFWPALHPLVTGERRLSDSELPRFSLLCILKDSLVELMTTLVEGEGPGSRIPRDVGTRLDVPFLLEEMAVIMAEQPVCELQWVAPRPNQHVRFGLVQHILAQRLFEDEKLANGVIERLENLACNIYMLLACIFLRNVDDGNLLVMDKTACRVLAPQHSPACIVVQGQTSNRRNNRQCVCFEHILQKLRSQTASVEIDTGDTLVQHFFRVPKHCLRLMEDASFAQRSEAIMRDIPRDNPDEKAVALLSRWKCISQEMLVAQYMANSGFFYRFREQLDRTPLKLSILIVIICIISYGETSTRFHEQASSEAVVNVLCILHVVTMAGTSWNVFNQEIMDFTAEFANHSKKEGDWFFTTANDPSFARWIYIIIVVNCTFTAFEMCYEPEGTMRKMLFFFEIIFTMIYTFEALVKIKAFHWTGYWSDHWNRLDFVLLVTCVLFTLVEITSAGLMGFIQLPPTVLRVVRALRLLRSLRFIKNIFEAITYKPKPKRQETQIDTTEFLMKSEWEIELPLPPSVPYDWELIDYAFRFLVSRRFYYTLGLMVLSFCGIQEPLLHFFQLVDFIRLPMTKVTMVAVRKSGTNIACTILVLIMTLVMLNGTDFLIFHWWIELPFGMNRYGNNTTVNDSLYEHFFRGLVKGSQGELSHLGVLIQRMPTQAPPTIGTEMASQVQIMIGVLWSVLYGFFFLGIVGGQITDGYLQTRDELLAVQSDESDKCLVCSLDRHTIDEITHGQSEKGFKQHLQSDHNPWAYVFFLHYLTLKDVDHMSGVEQGVADRLKQNGNTDFIPLHDCVSVRCNQQQQDAHGEIASQISELKAIVTREAMRLSERH